MFAFCRIAASGIRKRRIQKDLQQRVRVDDEGLEPTCVSPANNRGLRVTGIKAGPKAGPNLSLGELTCRLIERWDELDESVKAEIAELIRRD